MVTAVKLRVRARLVAALQIALMAWVMGVMVIAFLRQTWRGFADAAGQIWRDGA